MRRLRAAGFAVLWETLPKGYTVLVDPLTKTVLINRAEQAHPALIRRLLHAAAECVAAPAQSPPRR